jgi:LmbE family N-acetylglucosaminyl deacetylase
LIDDCNMRRIILSVLLLTVAFTAGSGAQHQLLPVAALRGRPAVELALRKLDTVGNFMMTTAHPDDENNAMLAYFGHGKGFRVSLVTATHGEGGQNEIGPELFEALAVLRTEELAAAHRYDGAEQYFTRAIDFGYSFSIDETFEKWGKQEILGDFVRMIRTIRPDVIIGFVFDGEGGGQHHQASSRLSAEAFRAAADPTAFPDQIQKEGLRPWQAKKFYYTAGFGGPGGGRRPLSGEGAPTLLMFAGGNELDGVLGRTYNEIGAEARSMHKCQGMSQLLPLPGLGDGPMGGGGPRAYRLRDSVLEGGVQRSEKEMFDGIDTRLASLAAYVGKSPQPELTNLLDRIAMLVAEARRALATGGEAATVAPLAGGLSSLRELRARLPRMGISDEGRYEIDLRLAQKEDQFAQALLLATDVRLEAVARDGLVVPGQAVQVDLLAANPGKHHLELTSAVNGFATAPAAEPCRMADLTPAGTSRCSLSAIIPTDARLTAAHFRSGPGEAARYVFDSDVPFGLPFRPTPYTATFTLAVEGTSFSTTLPVQFRSERNIFSGEKRAELHVVPKFAVSVSPEIAIASLAATPETARGAQRNIRVTVTNHSEGAAKAEVTLDLPQGWRATPASVPAAFTREDEAMTVRFTLAAPPPPMLKAGEVTVKARVSEPGATYGQGYQVVEYPHTTRRHVLRAPAAVVKALDVKVKPNLTIGYVMGVGDEIPAALEQLGARVAFIGADDLAWGDLARYDVIMTGVRAYERRDDLRAYNHRLMDYAHSGGTVIVNYNKFEFNEAQYAPYPVKVGRERVTAEDAPVHVLQPQHPVFTTPNRIVAADWNGWVQERGLYFLDSDGRDPQYADLIELDEPFPYNKGIKRGALVEAKVGRGRWIYLGIGLWRQLPAGTDGAYRLMANLISLGQAPRAQPTMAR